MALWVTQQWTGPVQTGMGNDDATQQGHVLTYVKEQYKS